MRMHGYSKHRTWRKIHLIVTSDGEIRAADMTTNAVSDALVLPGLLCQDKEASIGKFIGDGGYDKKSVYDICQQMRIKEIIIPPQKNARIWRHGNLKGEPHPRDENLRAIRRSSRRAWKKDVGYHVRSLAETAMFRLKTIFGDKLNARGFDNQKTEIMIKLSMLNKMRLLGMPDSYAVA